MTLYFHPWYHIITSIVGVCALIVAIIAWQRRPARGAMITAMMMCAVALWSLGSLGEFAVHTVAEKLLWVKLEYVGIAFCAPLWLIITMIYIGHEEVITRRNVALLLIIPTITVLLNWTNEYHYLSYISVRIEPYLDTPFLVVTYGVWTKIFIGYSYAISIAVISVCLYTMFTYSTFYRKQFSVIFIGALLPMVFNVIYVLHIGPLPYLDMTPMAFTISGALMVWGMSYYHYWDLVPVPFNMIVESLTDGILVLNHQMRIISLNTTAEKYLGRSQQSAIGQIIPDIAPMWEHLVALLPDELNEKCYSISYSLPEKVTYEVRVILFRKQEFQSPGRLIVIRNDTERNMLKERLQEMAFYDQLTGLPNRALFMDRLEQVLAMGQRNQTATAVMFLDLDRFKDVNDALGHSVGDEMLRQVATRLSAAMRTNDTIARLGGDEFVLILSGVSTKADISIAARRFLDAFTEIFELGNHRRDMSASIGISVAPYDGSTVAELMSHADEAMYRAKQQGKNTYCLYSSFPFE